MNIVYKIIFDARKTKKEYPYYYIGSKSNCNFLNGKIYDKNNRLYYGSAKYANYSKIVRDNINDLTIELLFESTDYSEILLKENEFHIKNNVVISPEYFNQSLAISNTFHDPNYAVMRNVLSNKICRILKNHPEINEGLWVGTTSGRSWYNNGINSKQFEKNKIPNGWTKGRLGDFSGKRNSFYGKKHIKKNLEKGVQTRYKNNSYVAWNKGLKGIRKHSIESRKKMSKYHKENSCGIKNSMYNRRWITNGEKNSTINKDENLPIGWRFGQTKRMK